MSEKIKISDLTASSTNNDDDLIIIVQENSNNELENFKQTREDFLAGVYEVPSGGIPKTDLASAVQTSLGKADTAVQNTDYANNNTGGVIKTMANYNTECDSQGRLRAITNSYVQYDALGNNAFIGKGTLENVITGKNLENTSNKVTSLSSSSTDTQYPSAKCVYDLIGDINNALDLINGEVIS